MGSTFANDLSSMGDLSLELTIGIHLRSNHFPPVPIEMVPVCIEAINAYWENDSNKEIELPSGTSWRGKEKAPAWAIIDGHHLEAWCELDEYEE